MDAVFYFGWSAWHGLPGAVQKFWYYVMQGTMSGAGVWELSGAVWSGRGKKLAIKNLPVGVLKNWPVGMVKNWRGEWEW